MAPLKPPLGASACRRTSVGNPRRNPAKSSSCSKINRNLARKSLRTQIRENKQPQSEASGIRHLRKRIRTQKIPRSVAKKQSSQFRTKRLLRQNQPAFSTGEFQSFVDPDSAAHRIWEVADFSADGQLASQSSASPPQAHKQLRLEAEDGLERKGRGACVPRNSTSSRELSAWVDRACAKAAIDYSSPRRQGPHSSTQRVHAAKPTGKPDQ